MKLSLIYYACIINLAIFESLSFERGYNRGKTYYIEKVFDELIRVPCSSGKFSKQLSAFLSDNAVLSNDIKNKKLSDIEEIVNLYNKG